MRQPNQKNNINKSTPEFMLNAQMVKKLQMTIMEESTIVMESTRSILKQCVQNKDGLEITNHSITLSQI